MSDYGWFAVKGIGYLVLIGFAVWMTNSALPLWALLLLPSWTGDERSEVRLERRVMRRLVDKRKKR